MGAVLERLPGAQTGCCGEKQTFPFHDDPFGQSGGVGTTQVVPSKVLP